jgi:peptidoglycan/LPS O-acetylase OafA/YrhL
MGLLRLILALNVVIAHAGGDLFKVKSVGGVIAVETFFIISGFYMSLILSGKYKGADKYGLFITNRLLRLFPIYFVVLILSVFAYFLTYKYAGQGFIAGFWAENMPKLSLSSLIIVFVTSFTLIGQEIFCFTGINPHTGNLFLSANFINETFQPFRFMFVPQAWTLSLELMFYFIAPFLINLRKRYIFMIITASLAARFITYGFGYTNDPWCYRFFPFEVAFFLVGVLCYKLYEQYKLINIPKKVATAILISLFAYIILFQYIPAVLWLKKWFLYAAMVVLLPILFKISKNNKIDRYIGELSYPVYICHVLVIDMLSLVFKPNFLFFSYSCRPLLAIILTIALSMLLNRFIADPVEKFRQQRVESSSKEEEKQPEPLFNRRVYEKTGR